MPTAIEWTHRAGTTGETWNPVTGCTMTSPGCLNCYAARMARRLDGRGVGYDGTTRAVKGWSAGALWSGVINYNRERLEIPLRWRKPRTVFVCSMADLFHEAVPFPTIAAIYGIMAAAPAHTFQVLTKRAARMAEFYDWLEGGPSSPQQICADHADEELINLGRAVWERPDDALDEWPLPNVWAGVSVERQQELDARLQHLERVPAAVRFLSCEPLLGPLDFMDGPTSPDSTMGPWSNLELGCIHWVIAGGESGAGARPPHPAWFRALRDDCLGAGVPFFFKQWGSWAPLEAWSVAHLTDAEIETRRHEHKDGAEMVCVGKKRAGRKLDGRTWDEMPGDR